MARCTGERRIGALVVVMRRGRVLVGRMALQADAVARKPQAGAVRLVAVAAGDARREHLALLERTVVENLVEHLPVGMVEPAGERRDPMRVRQPSAGDPILRERATTRVTQPAGLHLLAQHRRGEGVGRVPYAGVDRPDTIPPLVEANQQAHGWVFGFAEGPPALTLAGPGDMARALAVAGLAADADLGPGGGEAVVRRIIVLVHARRVALGAHEVPVLVQLGPMQDIVVADLLMGIEVEPALAAVVLRSAVPGDRQRLQAAVRERDQVLLQRLDAEGVFHLERGELSIGSVGLDEEPAVLAEKAGWHAVVLKARIVEVAQHRFLGGMLHRALVLRGAPQLRLGAVAAGARLAAHEGGRRGGVRASAAGPGVGSV